MQIENVKIIKHVRCTNLCALLPEIFRCTFYRNHIVRNSIVYLVWKQIDDPIITDAHFFFANHKNYI